ncbi:MAG: sigma-70 family RNA polymerase sigma factor [Planctomycetes bacterium]|nr:sigma-70 family RNA polymerase sigma factor [Planctomycetota bacterium]
MSNCENSAESDSEVDSRSEFMELLVSIEYDLMSYIGSLEYEASAREDVFQEVVVTMWQKYATYNPEFSFGAWARGIAKFKLMQRWSKIKSDRKHMMFSSAAIEAVDEAYKKKDHLLEGDSARQDFLNQCLERLPEERRSLLRWKYEKGCSLKKLAEMYDKKIDAISKVISRLRKSLLECVREKEASLQ